MLAGMKSKQLRATVATRPVFRACAKSILVTKISAFSIGVLVGFNPENAYAE